MGAFFIVALEIDYEKQLNPDQLAAVMAPPNRPALVLAGAGSGKTRTLTYRVAWLISECGIKPWRILLLTFTNKAAAQMLERIEKLTGFAAGEFFGGTFHSIGCRFLRIYAEKVGLEPNFTILDAEDSVKLLKSTVELVNPRFFSTKTNPKAALLFEIISFARNTMSSLEQAMVDRFPWIETPVAQIEEISAAYAKAKRVSNSCDFDDMLELWHKLLLENPDVLQKYRDRFKNILVDEYQDTNRLQSAILDLIADRGQISAVGDDAQCIYSWRGAEIDNILTFKDRYPAANIYKIERNYRSSPQILRFANRILDQMPTDENYRKVLVPAREGYHKPVVVSALDASSQARMVCELIREVVGEGVYEYSDIAVLYRSHFQAMDLQLQLQYKNIPFAITSGLKFFEQAHIKDVVAQIKFASNPKDFVSFHRFVRFMDKVGDKTARKIYDAAATLAKKRDISIHAALSDKSVLGKVPSVSREIFAQMAAEMLELSADIARSSSASASRIVDSAAMEAQSDAAAAQPSRQLNLFDFDEPESDVPSTSSAENPMQGASIPAPILSESHTEKLPEELVKKVCSGWYKTAMMGAYEDYPERAKDFDALMEYASRYPNFDEFLANVALEVSEARVEQQPEEFGGRVRLMTVHQAKGLEFPVVFVIGAADGLFPTKRSIDDGDVDEERRLFYVAATRAMEHLIITYPKVAVVGGEIQSRPISRFLEPIPRDYYTSEI